MSRKGRRKKPHREFHRRTGPGAAPGSIVSDPHALRCRIKVFSYGPEDLVEREITNPLQLREFVGQRHVTWINVDGLGDADVIQQLGDLFGLHPLALEDVVNVHQRAKVEDYGRQLFIVARMIRFRAPSQPAHEAGSATADAAVPPVLESEQISLFLGKDFVITFQEDAIEDCFDPVRARLRQNSVRLRQGGADSLTHALLDAVTDSYFPVIESYREELDQLDDELAEFSRAGTLHRIHEIRTDLLMLRRAAWPLREAFQNLIRESHTLISADTRIYLRDCYDHAVQIIDVLETYRELCADLREYYFSSIGQRTNDIMKVLTIIATIFIPLSFVAGVYGMNFDTSVSPWNMPELKWAYGYPFAWAVMGLVAGGLLYYVWRKGWFRK
jgi:magnesium transporter